MPLRAFEALKFETHLSVPPAVGHLRWAATIVGKGGQRGLYTTKGKVE